MDFDEDVWTAPDGTRLRWRAAGSGRVVVMLHGFLADAERNFVEPGIAAALAAADHRVLMPDLRGHGGSEAPADPGRWPPDVLAADGLGLVAAQDLIDYDLVGYSLGARTAVRMMALGARPRRAVLGGMGAEGVTAPEARALWFADLVRLGGAAADPRAGRRVEKMIAAAGLSREALLGALASARATPPEVLASIKVPTLVLSGDLDEDNGSAEALAALLGAGRAQRTPGDHLTAFARPDFVAALLDFLRAPAPLG